MYRRRALIVLGLVIMVVKLRIAATTEGTNDVVHWRDFADAVRHLGPVGVYSTRFITPYNHPPLIGWMLVAVNAIADRGPSVRFLIRVPACVADLGSIVLVFELLRTRRGLNEATIAAVIVALSPVLFVISGFHGNTDPLLVFFVLLSAYLLVDRDRPTSRARLPHSRSG